MTRVKLEIYDDLITAINKIKHIQDTGVELEVPQGSVLFDNILNLKLLMKEAERLDMVLHIMTDDEIGNKLINSLNDENPVNNIQANTDISPLEYRHEEKTKRVGKKLKFDFKVPRINLKLPKKGFFLFLILAIGLGLFINNRFRQQKATVKIVVNSQPLARSITIKVKSNVGQDDVSNKILKGSQLSADIESTVEIETTGEKTVGEKAEGKATIYNKTSTEKEFKKGTLLAFDEKDINFVTKEDVTVNGAAPQDPLDPASPIIPGSAEVDIGAEEIGENYNIDDNELLEITGQKKADFEAKTSEKTSGGKSEKVKIVSEEDKTKLQKQGIEKVKSESNEALKRKVSNTQSLIEGSAEVNVAEEKYSHEIGEETEKLTLAEKTNIKGLIYNKKDLDNLLDKLVEDLVPEGYVISSKDREISIEVLGNSSESTLNSTEADLQVTFKTFIDPKIDEEKLKEDLLNKSPDQAQKILGSLQNVKTYSLDISNRLPLFDKIPGNKDKIEIFIERE